MGGGNLPEQNRAAAVFGFLLGLVELGIAYGVYEIYNPLNASYITSSGVAGASAQAASGFLTVLILLAVFIGLHGIKRIIDNMAVFARTAAAATRSMAADSQGIAN